MARPLSSRPTPVRPTARAATPRPITAPPAPRARLPDPRCEQPGTRDHLAIRDTEHMQRRVIEPVRVQISAPLLDDEHLLPKLKHAVQLAHRQRVEGAYPPAHVFFVHGRPVNE